MFGTGLLAPIYRRFASNGQSAGLPSKELPAGHYDPDNEPPTNWRTALRAAWRAWRAPSQNRRFYNPGPDQ